MKSLVRTLLVCLAAVTSACAADPVDPGGSSCEGLTTFQVPVIDPATLPACCAEQPEGSAHCVPTSLVPADFVSRLAACDATNSCVPDQFIEAGGVIELSTCASVNAAEGRCLSVCVPEVGNLASLLPQDTCPVGDRCVPCISPLDGQPTGVCNAISEPAPTEELPADCQ